MIEATFGLPFLAMLLTCGVVFMVGRLNAPRRLAARDMARDMAHEIGFLFDGTHLLDATPEGRALLRHTLGKGNEWDSLIALLTKRFPGLSGQLDDLPDQGEIRVSPADGGDGWVDAEHWDGLTRLMLRSTDGDQSNLAADLMKRALRDEAEALRSVTDQTAQAMWRIDAGGQITWANAAYLDLADKVSTCDESAWPPPLLFATPDTHDETGPLPARMALRDPLAETCLWFDVTLVPQEDGHLGFATEISELVQAQDARREMMQTLTKTFAGLTIGLAVFDENRHLILFNPALADLTSINPTELVQMPQLDSFLDKLRENRILPEPRDYSAWRDQIIALEAAAENGDHIEDWALCDGRSYRVTGRPFPNGAIAFLFEDITNRISASRNLRADLALRDTALDGLPLGVIALNDQGNLLYANTLAQDLLGMTEADDGALPFDDVLTRLAAATSDDLGSALTTMVSAGRDAPSLDMPLRLADGRRMQLTSRHAAGDHHLILRPIPSAKGLLAPPQPSDAIRASA